MVVHHGNPAPCIALGEVSHEFVTCLMRICRLSGEMLNNTGLISYGTGNWLSGRINLFQAELSDEKMLMSILCIHE